MYLYIFNFLKEKSELFESCNCVNGLLSERCVNGGPSDRIEALQASKKLNGFSFLAIFSISIQHKEKIFKRKKEKEAL